MAEDQYKTETRFGAKFIFSDGTAFDLQIEQIEDGFEKAIAEYTFPYMDGALLEDMGQRARRVRFRCYFYNETYASHITLINYLSDQGLVDLVHPEYGLLKGSIETMGVRQDDRKQTAEMDICFVENLIGNAGPGTALDVKGSIEDAFAAGQEEQMGWFSDYVMKGMGPEGAKVLSQTLDFTQPGVLSQFADLTIGGRNFVQTVDTFVRLMDGTLANIDVPADSLVSVIDYGPGLSGRVTSSAAKAVERYAVLYNTTGCAPARFLDNLKDGIETLAGGAGTLGQQTRCAGALRLALEAAYVYDADEQAYNWIKQTEGKNQRAFDAMGNNVGAPPEMDIMSANDYEGTLNLVRGYIEKVLETARTAGEDLPSLKAEALTLLQFADQVKTERANVIQVSVANPTPLHLICLQQGLDYHAAERVISINPQITLPSFTQGMVNIYAG